MGVLKHAILPLLALLNGMSALASLSGRTEFPKELADLPGMNSERTPLERHLMFVWGGVTLSQFLACILGIFYENSHFRGVVVLMNLIVISTDAYDWATREGFRDNTGFVWGLAGLASLLAISLVIHSMEPGIFTKDKSKKVKNG